MKRRCRVVIKKDNLLCELVSGRWKWSRCDNLIIWLEDYGYRNLTAHRNSKRWLSETKQSIKGLKNVLINQEKSARSLCHVYSPIGQWTQEFLQMKNIRSSRNRVEMLWILSTEYLRNYENLKRIGITKKLLTTEILWMHKKVSLGEFNSRRTYWRQKKWGRYWEPTR